MMNTHNLYQLILRRDRKGVRCSRQADCPVVRDVMLRRGEAPWSAQCDRNRKEVRWPVFFLLAGAILNAQPPVAPTTNEPIGNPRGDEVGGYNILNSVEL